MCACIIFFFLEKRVTRDKKHINLLQRSHLVAIKYVTHFALYGKRLISAAKVPTGMCYRNCFSRRACWRHTGYNFKMRMYDRLSMIPLRNIKPPSMQLSHETSFSKILSFFTFVQDDYLHYQLSNFDFLRCRRCFSCFWLQFFFQIISRLYSYFMNTILKPK